MSGAYVKGQRVVNSLPLLTFPLLSEESADQFEKRD